MLERLNLQPRPFPFLSLPWEIRDTVYRELLIPEKARNLPDDLYYYALHPQILCVNRQIHTEANRIFQSETTWVCVSVIDKGHFNPIPRGVFHRTGPFNWNKDTHGSHPKQPALILALSDGVDRQPIPVRPTYGVVSLSNLHLFLNQFSKRNRRRLQITLSLAEVKHDVEAQIMDQLLDFRGFRHLDAGSWRLRDGEYVHVIKSLAEYIDLRANMESVWGHIPSIVARMQELSRLGSKAFEENRMEEAHTLYDRGFRFLRQMRYADMIIWQPYAHIFLWIARTICHFHLGCTGNPERIYGSFQPFPDTPERMLKARAQLLCMEGFALWVGECRLQALDVWVQLMELRNLDNSVPGDDISDPSTREEKVGNMTARLKEMLKKRSLATLREERRMEAGQQVIDLE